MIQGLLAERTQLDGELARIRDAEEQLRAELQGRGRIQVLDEGEVPDEPREDRRALLAAGLGAAGVGLAVCLSLFGGLLARRRRNRP